MPDLHGKFCHDLDSWVSSFLTSAHHHKRALKWRGTRWKGQTFGEWLRANKAEQESAGQENIPCVMSQPCYCIHSWTCGVINHNVQISSWTAICMSRGFQQASSAEITPKIGLFLHSFSPEGNMSTEGAWFLPRKHDDVNQRKTNHENIDTDKAGLTNTLRNKCFDQLTAAYQSHVTEWSRFKHLSHEMSNLGVGFVHFVNDRQKLTIISRAKQ